MFTRQWCGQTDKGSVGWIMGRYTHLVSPGWVTQSSGHILFIVQKYSSFYLLYFLHNNIGNIFTYSNIYTNEQFVMTHI